MNLRSFFIFLTFLPLFTSAQQAVHQDYTINSAYEEREPILSADGKTVYFWRREMPSNTGGIMDPGDIWMAQKDARGKWKPAVRMGAPLNSNGHDFVWQVSPRHDTLWVAQVPPGVRNAGIGYSVRTSQGFWTRPQKVHIRNFVYQGSYKDYFLTKNRFLLLPNVGADTYGGTDIYVCFPLKDTAWSGPINLGPVINTYGDDDAPYLADDGVTLYFNSNGRGESGDHDVFVSKRLDNTWRNWSTPEPIGAPVNSKGYDFDFTIAPDGKSAWWCSDQKALGSNDIFYLDLSNCALNVFPAGNHTLCRGESFDLEAGFTTGKVLRYQWLKNGSPVRGGTVRKLHITESGQYRVVRVKDNCIDTSAVQHIRFVPAPDASVESPSDVLCLEDSIQLRAVTSSGNTFQWRKNNLEIPGANRTSYWVKSPGKYSVVVSNGNCATPSAALNLRKFTPPVVFSDADTINGLLPILPRWLWTNKLPKEKGVTYVKDIAAGPNGSAYTLSSIQRRGKYFDRITGFFPTGLYRVSFTEEKRETPGDPFIAVDPDGNLVVVNNDTYISKYRPDGRLMWKKDESRQKVTGVATDPLGYIYTTGRFREPTFLAGQEMKPANRGGLFLAKHSPRGELIWLKQFAVDWYKYGFGNAVHTDCNGNVYLSGGFKMIANFEAKILRASLTGENYFVTKFDPNGALQWAQKINTDKTRLRTHDVHTDCEGTTFISFNRILSKLDANGINRWQGRLVSPSGATTLNTRIHSADGDLYVSGFTDRNDYFVTKLNRLNRQVIIWQTKGAGISEDHLPAISADQDGNVFVAGISKSNDFPGAQFDLTSGSDAFLLKYGKPEFKSRREPLTICKGETRTLMTQTGTGLSYQWIRNGKDIAGGNSSTININQAGTYQVRAFADYCERLSEPVQVTACGDDPMAKPPVTASPVANKTPPPVQIRNSSPPPKPTRPAPEPKSEISFDLVGQPKKIRNRRVKTQKEIVITNPKATIYIWDHAAEDRDTVSINVNGEWLVREFGLTKKRKAIEFEFRPGPNFIILYAHNLGYTPPNTASIMVDDGTKKQSLQLRSNLRNCGKLTIRLQ